MRLHINEQYCKGCSLCIYICPKKCYDEGKELSEKGYAVPLIARLEDCIDYKQLKNGKKKICELCILICPEHAIEWVEK